MQPGEFNNVLCAVTGLLEQMDHASCRPIATAFTLQGIAKIQYFRTMKCLNNTNAVSFSTRSLHIFTGWLIPPVPVIIIWRLQNADAAGNPVDVYILCGVVVFHCQHRQELLDKWT